MDRDWVIRCISILDCRLGRSARYASLFEPTPAFYAGLAEGDADALQSAAQAIAVWLGLGNCPAVSYEWGLFMAPTAAGDYRCAPVGRSAIRVPIASAGFPLALGAILAHELSHEILARNAIAPASIDELELLTDLTSIHQGLGKLVLNGTVAREVLPLGDWRFFLGYLAPDLKAFAFRLIAARCGLKEQDLLGNLCPEGVAVLGEEGRATAY